MRAPNPKAQPRPRSLKHHGNEVRKDRDAVLRSSHLLCMQHTAKQETFPAFDMRYFLDPYSHLSISLDLFVAEDPARAARSLSSFAWLNSCIRVRTVEGLKQYVGVCRSYFQNMCTKMEDRLEHGHLEVGTAATALPQKWL